MSQEQGPWSEVHGCGSCISGIVPDADGVFQACGDCGTFEGDDDAAQAAAVDFVAEAYALLKRIGYGRPLSGRQAREKAREFLARGPVEEGK